MNQRIIFRIASFALMFAVVFFALPASLNMQGAAGEVSSAPPLQRSSDSCKPVFVPSVFQRGSLVKRCWTTTLTGKRSTYPSTKMINYSFKLSVSDPTLLLESENGTRIASFYLWVTNESNSSEELFYMEDFALYYFGKIPPIPEPGNAQCPRESSVKNGWDCGSTDALDSEYISTESDKSGLTSMLQPGQGVWLEWDLNYANYPANASPSQFALGDDGYGPNDKIIINSFPPISTITPKDYGVSSN